VQYDDQLELLNILYTASAIIDGNAVKANTIINLKGILIGNGVLVSNVTFAELTTFNFLLEHNLFDYKTT